MSNEVVHADRTYAELRELLKDTLVLCSEQDFQGLAALRVCFIRIGTGEMQVQIVGMAIEMWTVCLLVLI